MSKELALTLVGVLAYALFYIWWGNSEALRHKQEEIDQLQDRLEQAGLSPDLPTIKNH